ncbi:MAG: hypothetical protein JSV71_04400 [Nitrospiraceae bacterium]|nr:MAG: hypothetical protein EP227_06455 [bacterium]UCF86731.1 MAG: hypothetical protein JSV71_04400 [Nitrospiraceae bacterium]
MGKLTLTILSIFIFMTPLQVSAADFDGSKTLLCSLFDAMECTEETLCQKVTTEDINAPQFVKIDFNKGMIIPVQGGSGKKGTAIENKERIDGKLFLQGAEDGFERYEDGLGWSIAIKESTGRLVLTASGGDVGFFILGACTPLDNIK